MANYKIGVEFEADGSKAVSAINQVAQAMQNMQNQVGKNSASLNSSLSATLSQLSSKLSSFGTNMTAMFTAPLALLGKSLFQSASQIEQAAISFEVFTGSAETAKRLMEEFKNIAVNSPLQFQDIATGSQVLMGYGVTANQVTPIVKMLGDISGGNADKFSRLALAFGQVNAAGRLMGQENRQMINAGFNPLLAISEKTGESMASLSQRMKEGRISVQEVADAFYYATSEGGRFNGMAQKQSETLGGLFNKLNESIFLALADIGNALAKNTGVKDFFKSIASSVDSLKNSIMSISPEWQSFILKSGLLLAALGPIAIVIASVTKAVLALRAAFLLLNLSTAGWLALSGAVIYGLMKLASWIGETASKSKAGALAFTEYKNALNEAMDNTKGFKFDSVSAQITVVEGKIKALSAVIEQQKLFNGGNAIISNAQINQLESYKKELQNLKDIQQKNLGFSTTGKGEELDNKDAERLAKKLEREKRAKAEQDRIDGDYHQKRRNYIDDLRSAEIRALDDADSAFETSLEKKLDKLTKNFEAQKALYKQYGLEYNNIQEAYLVQYAELVKAIDDKRKSILTGAMDRSIPKYQENRNYVMPDNAAEAFGFTKAQTDAQKGNMERFGAEMYNSMITVASQLANGFAEIVGSIMSGDYSVSEAFSALGAMFTGAIGEFLVEVGQSAIRAGIIKSVIEGAFKGLSGGALIAVGMAAVAIGTQMKNYSRKTSEALNASMNTKSIGSSSVASRSTGYASNNMRTGTAYQNGSATYGGQVVRLSIDLTGAITASPTGYNINKSLETVLRVTGR